MLPTCDAYHKVSISPFTPIGDEHVAGTGRKMLRQRQGKEVHSTNPVPHVAHPRLRRRTLATKADVVSAIVESFGLANDLCRGRESDSDYVST